MNPITIFEIIATLSGIVCVYLQTREKISAWAFGIVSVSISTFIFYQSKLYSDVILHIAFILLNIFGWWSWSRKKRGDESRVPISVISWKQRSMSLSLLLLGTILWGFAMTSLTDADLPYFDAFTTVGSLIAQVFLAKKFLENWILWITVDIVAVNVYLYKELYFIAFLFFVYLVLCVKGYKDWKKELGLQILVASSDLEK